ncbi:hypothetical protein [Methylocystis heyeri]|uniref:Uncharacterized protein n=1 Tax=Methylocystis heyeri TaxID=391905 RepID=A0A6B8K9V4_9HYPH|nr:hypothetical protein [Methylocystis heyeri]QGM44876.1 hypothetical protein H2LOC_003775 [Methylocystis heyeri]
MTPKKTAPDAASAPIADLSALPQQVAAIRDKILAACDKGELEALRIPIDWNETRPMFERGAGKHPAGTDPIAILRAQSFDSRGFEILNLARAVLSQPYARIQRGPVTIYEWPAFPGPPATEAEERAQWSCVRFSDLAHSQEEGRPRVMRMGFGADGVWHYFWSET